MLPKPSESLSKTSNVIADLKIGDLALPFLVKDNDDYVKVLTALRVAFWAAFWEECSVMKGSVEREFMSAKQTCARGTLLVGPEAIETATRRGRFATREWAGPNWRGASYESTAPIHP